MDAVVLVPVKAFRDAKARLSGVLDAASRARLSRWTAERVIAAAGELPVYVACDDDEVATWAGAHGATVLWHPGEGLNGAVNASIAALRDRRVSHVVIAHGDLPRPAPLAALVTPGMITLVPDRRDDGTNVAAVPTGTAFELSYGPGSFRRHVDAAMALGLPLQVCRHPTLSLDIDTPADLLHPLVLEVLPEWLRTNPANHLQP
jgi:2-phospho-L-lactate guanylyltransferase